MSLYNMLFGISEAAPLLLAALGLTKDDVPRFRDCYIEDGEIVIYTRTGGGNREEYEGSNAELAQHEHYLRDIDSDYDSTYAEFYFQFPPELAKDLKALEDANETHTPSEKWAALFATLQERSK